MINQQLYIITHLKFNTTMNVLHIGVRFNMITINIEISWFSSFSITLYVLSLCKKNTSFKNMNQGMQAIKIYSKEHVKHE